MSSSQGEQTTTGASSRTAKDSEQDTEPLTSRQEVIIGASDQSTKQEFRKQEIERMREISGTVGSDDPLVAFLYVMCRDKLPLGDVEHIIDLAYYTQVMSRGSYVFTNGWLAEWAKDAARRLTKPAPSDVRYDLTEAELELARNDDAFTHIRAILDEYPAEDPVAARIRLVVK